MAVEIEAVIAAEPDKHGWVFGGQIVAPAGVDPYLRIMPVARQILDQFGRLLDPTDRERVLDGLLYPYNYTLTATAFRDGARDVLATLQDAGAVVVTNSATDAVQTKIRQLADDARFEPLAARVHGHAKKYMVDAAFDAVPESISLPGLSRPVLLRRAKYHAVLDELRTAANAEWRDVTVIGDIFELDLALPLAMGARVGLLASPFTPRYESEFIAGDERGTLLQSLRDVPAFVGL